MSYLMAGLGSVYTDAIADAVKRGAPPEVVADWKVIESDPQGINVKAWQPGQDAFGTSRGPIQKALDAVAATTGVHVSPMVAGGVALLTTALVGYAVYGGKSAPRKNPAKKRKSRARK